jgi:hypothetical protein
MMSDTLFDEKAQKSSALDQLFVALEAALKVHVSDARHGRAGMILALEAVSKFINSVPKAKRKRLDWPLLNIRAALIELDDGNTSIVLAPNKRNGGRTSEGRTRAALQVAAVRVAKAIVEVGYPTLEADKLVARELEKAGFKAGRGIGHVTPRTIRTWRNRASTEEILGKSHIGQFPRRIAKVSMAPKMQATKSAAAALFLKRLRHLAENFRAREL